MPKFDYDLLVIGGGIAGFTAAAMVNGLGKKVAIVEKGKLGGSCTWSTCAPAKALIEAAAVAQRVKEMGKFGLRARPPFELDGDNVMAYVRSVIKKIYETDSPESFERIGIRILSGAPEFIDNHRIRLGDKTLSASKFIIATGARAVVPPINGLGEVPYLTNENVFDLDTLPRSMIILGGGPAGIEFGQAFNRLGTRITVVEMADRILFRDDRELVEMLAQKLKAEGVEILTGRKAIKFARDKDRIALTVQDEEGNTQQLKAETALIALGRKANVEGLSLEKAGVEYTPRGISTNNRLQTSVGNIYACGDVVGPYQFAAVAEYQAIIAAENAFLPLKRSVDYKNLVWVTFVDPGLGHAGLTEAEARKIHGDRIKVCRYEYKRAHRAQIDLTESGMAKFILDSRGRLLGAHIFGYHAEDLIHEAQLIKSLKIPLSRVHSIIHAFPTYSEGIIKRIADLSYIDSMRRNPLIRFILKVLPGYRDNLDTVGRKL